ncbi:hypothetical protein PsYK624_095600 [Phanerochaete sordida]|uniref:Uncharacterized protein n=1 Tax=Phanerochaete sordida TaxID=48140 RepID=A0A9P3LFC1_9APHY|nr:hypothetical protein PsYK624_095600 [Phanerochaete sordida]
MGPGRSPSRLRSKTSDISDIIRGNQQSTDALVPPVPAVPPVEATTPTKNKRRLAGLLGRKRKSGGFALDSNHRDDEEAYPAIPEALLKSRIPAPSGSSLPSSLPPLNVSPPSFGAAFPPTSPPVAARFSTATHDSAHTHPAKPPSTDTEKPTASSSKGGALRILRPQKSISFEVSRPFDFTHRATATNMEMLNSANDSKAKAKPVITVSAPANDVAEDAEIYNAPRAAPAPPAPAKARGSRFGFGHSSKRDESSKREHRSSAAPAKDKAREAASSDDASRTPTISPMLPAKMEFPLPPSSKSMLPRTTAQPGPPLAEAFEHSAKTPVARSYRSAPTSDASDGELTQASSRSMPARPARPASLIIPPAVRPRSNSSQTVKVPSSPSSPHGSGKPSPSPSRLRTIRAGRSSSPASPPPVTPLPSPPTSATFPHSSDAEGWSTDASTRLGGWSTDTSTRIGSLASRKSMQSTSRARAHTIVGSISSKPSSVVSSGLSSGGEDSERARMRYMRPNASAIQLDQTRSSHSGARTPREHATDSGVDDQSLLIPSRPPSEGSHNSGDTSTPTRDDTQSQSLRNTHDTYVRVLQEKHAAEKAELFKRIDRLEREARKRDREIKGLRWLILNAREQGNGPLPSTSLLTLDDDLKMGRLRSGSKSSEMSAASSASRSRTSSGLRHRTDGSIVNMDSPRESTEDGVLEVQEQVSDLIAPWQTYTARIEPAEGERSGSPSSVSSLRRCNTMPDREARAAKLTKRTSSPVLPASGGLGFDIPSMPGSSSDMSMTDVVSSASVPSLTASASASSQASTLSAIPELNATPPGESPDKREKRTSRALKRMSASSIMQAAQTYASNLKIGMSPSIGQVLDRGRTPEESSMDEVLRKLRAFGGEHH